MSSFKGIARVKLWLKTVVALTVCVSVAGCFHPLYGTTGGGPSTTGELAAIDVLPLPDLAGHYLREELLFNFSNGNNAAVKHAYKLSVKLVESSVSVAIDPSSGRSDAAALQLTANYTLMDLNGKALTDGSVFATASIDRLSQRFAAVRAQQDARVRLAKDLAEQIKLNLAAYFSTRG
jgi:LPS-assembly lipoprotein